MNKINTKNKSFKHLSEQLFKNCKTSPVRKPSPWETRRLLVEKCEQLQEEKRLFKNKIQKIIEGKSIESIKFKQIEKNCCFEELLKKYYRLNDTKSIFTSLIIKNSLVSDITFVDFKLKNYRIMNSYVSQLRQLNYKKFKEFNIGSSNSSTKEDRGFKQKQIQVIKITKGRVKSSKKTKSNNSSTTFLNQLTKNIQKMVKQVKDTSNLFQIDTEYRIGGHKQPRFDEFDDISKISQERLYTSPQIDSYGIQSAKGKKTKKKIETESGKKPKINMKTERMGKIQMERHLTEYDTEFIRNSSRTKFLSKSKKRESPMMALNKVKSTSIMGMLKIKK